MKKIVSILMLLSLFLVGCNKVDLKKYDSYIWDMSNDGLIGSAEVDYWSGATHQYENVQKTKHIEHEKNEYDIDYYCSWFGAAWPVEVNEYYSTDGNWRFLYRSDTDEMVYYDDLPGLMEEEFASTVTMDEAREISNEKAKDYIDFDDYVLSASKRIVAGKEMGYHFSYVRYVNDLATIDALAITVNKGGKIVSVSWPNLGTFKNVDNINFDIADVDRSVKEKIKDVYEKNAYDGYKVQDYEKVYQKLTYTPLGELSIVTGMNIKLVSRYDGTQIPTSAFILTIL